MDQSSSSTMLKKTENKCVFCGLVFGTWDDLHQHKIHAKDHITCHKCSQDFNSHDGYRAHRLQMHAAEQDLHCSTCNQRFTRMGGLICHIENGQCEAISKAKFKQTLLENQKKEDDQERQRAFLLYGRTAGGFGTQSPATSARDEKTLSDVPFGGNVKLELASLSATNKYQVSEEDSDNVGVPLDENLISFNAPSRTLDSTWGEPKAPARHINARTNTTRLATPTATSTANSTDAPKKVGYVPPHLRVLVSEPQYSLGYISPPLRHLPPSPQPKTKSENGTKGQVASAGRSSSGTFTSFAPPAQNQGQPGPPSGMQQQSPWSGAVNSSQGPPTPRVAATQSTINQRKNAPIGQNSGFKYNNPKAFPALQTQKTVVKSVQNIIDTPKMELRKENVAWCVKNDLFPEAPPAVAPLAGLMESMTLSPPEEENPDNPDNPKFNVAHYFVSLTRKYKCPYKGCKKSLETVPAFVQHLRSAAHRNEKLKCTTCLRYFSTATALTQHSESQGNRCKAREQQFYNDEVEKFTAGVGAVGGLHNDMTLKYVLGPTLNPAIDASRASKKADIEALGEEFNAIDIIRAANKAANDAKTERFNTFWDHHDPKW